MNLRSIKKETFLLPTIILAFFGGVFISYPLWLNDRLLPPLPVFDFLLTHGFIHYLVLAGLFISGFLSLFKHKTSKYALIIFLCILLLLCLQDMNRWQPWVYIFFIFLSTLCCVKFNLIDEDKVLGLFRVAFIGVYFWSGVHKFNAGFVENVFPQIMPFGIDLGDLAYLISIIETSFAIGLIFRQTRKPSVVLLTTMHLLIFAQVLFGPWFYDLVIIPWNIAMIILLFVLFWNNEQMQTFKKSSVLNAFYLAIFFLLPASNFVGFWHSYPSFSLFSGKTDRAYLYTSERFKERVLPSTLEHFNEENRLYVQKYSYSELRVPFYPEQKNYINLFTKLCEESDNDLSLILEIETLPNLFEYKWESKSYFCDDF